MTKAKFLRISLVCVFNLTIAIAYYIENLDVTYSELSTDLLNIIPIANKFDNPNFYKNDLYVNDIENVKYYTPFFVQPLRFIGKLTENNYLQALNILGLFCHLAFGLLWFLLFYRYCSDFWVAFLMSILVRGVIWLPGLELLGISGLWTMVPRTLYLTLFPIPFLVLGSNIKAVIFSSFLIGLIFNFHPITGLGGILLYLVYVLYFGKKKVMAFKTIFSVLVALILGMLPFIITYFSKTTAVANYSMAAYEQAFSFRIPNWFTDPISFLRTWLSRASIFMFIPTILYFLITKFRKEDHWHAKGLVVVTLVLFVLPLLSVYVEQWVNSLFGLNLRLSFQLIRMQKMAVIPSYFALAALFVLMTRYIKFKGLIPILTGGFLCLLIFSKSSTFKGVSLVDNDMFRSILPFNLSVSGPSQKRNEAKDAMARYIEKNTDLDAIIFGDYLYRSASKRSVILDTKGASMLIEGNPERLIDWYQSKMKFRGMNTITEKMDYLRSLGVDYYVTQNTSYNLEIVHKEKDWLLYKL